MIDVGVSRSAAGIAGDVAFDEVQAVAGAITPNPKGTGPMTVACLLENTLPPPGCRAPCRVAIAVGERSMAPMSDEQDVAESVDEEMLGTDAVTSDEVGAFDDAPDRPVGLPFADADVTDESFAERSDREVPELLEDDPDLPLRLVEPGRSSSTPTSSRTSTRTAISPSRTDDCPARAWARVRTAGRRKRAHALVTRSAGGAGSGRGSGRCGGRRRTAPARAAS